MLQKWQVWESDLPIHTNLERLLEISLPMKQTLQQDNENHEVTCIICYSERLNGEVPSRTCDNPQCGQSFHIYCLYEVYGCTNVMLFFTCSLLDIVFSVLKLIVIANTVASRFATNNKKTRQQSLWNVSILRTSKTRPRRFSTHRERFCF